MKLKLFTLGAAAVAAAMIAFSSVAMAEVIDSGNCGTNAVWSFDDGGTLLISGKGEMTGFSYSHSKLNRPWEEYVEEVTNVVIEPGITTIGSHSFTGMTNLQTVSIPEGITIIDEAAFGECSSLIHVELPDSVQSLRTACFRSCSSLSSVTIPTNLTSIWGSAFSFCQSLTEITLPEGITSVSYQTFEKCEALRNIYFPSTLRSISYDAFRGAGSNMKGYYNGSKEDWEKISGSGYFLQDYPDRQLYFSKAEVYEMEVDGVTEQRIHNDAKAYYVDSKMSILNPTWKITVEVDGEERIIEKKVADYINGTVQCGIVLYNFSNADEIAREELDGEQEITAAFKKIVFEENGI
ncbi:MAG: leucine-rich repeat domain-containing protein [bacterium]|nr:leucine-rich repeat domain-containing protein [bacterium]